jgi:hypothetical protein
VNLLEFNLQHVIVLLKHLQNVDPIQLMLQLHVERLQLNNAKQDANHNQHNQHHVIALLKLFHNVDHHQQMDQLHVEHKFT